MRIEYKILAALKERQKDLNNLERNLETLTKLSENSTSIIIVQELILKHLKNETN
jgi:hypothetical protein